MRRRSIHAAFAALALGCLGVAVVQGLRLRQAEALNAAVAAVSAAPAASDAAPAPRDGPRELRLAQATALARAGAFDAAFKSYSGLIGTGENDAIGRAALFNLGNMYLRQGSGLGAPDGAPPAGADAAPLVELAKQRYRDLLRAAPDDWDARYNLERALRLAPEEEQAFVEDPNVPVERRRVMLRGMDPGDLP